MKDREPMAGEEIRIGFLGFGEAGYEIAKGLRSAGIRKIAICHRKVSDPDRVALIKSRADEVGAEYLGSIEDVVQVSDVVISVVVPGAAEEVVNIAATCIRPGQTYLDLTSSEPIAMKRAAETIIISGGEFIDGAIMTSVPVYSHKVLIYASGRMAQQLALKLNQYGMNIQVVGEETGKASAVKLLVSVTTKGLEALFVEMLLAAHHYAAEGKVLEALNEFFKMGLLPMVDRFVGSDAIHAKRRAEEMKGAVEMLTRLGIEPIMSAATVKRLSWSATLGLCKYFGDIAPKSYQEVISAWEQEGLFKNKAENNVVV